MARLRLSVCLIGLLGGCSTTVVDQTPCKTNTECDVFGAGFQCKDGFCAEGGTVTKPLMNGVSSEMVRTVGIADISGSLADLGGGMRDGVMAAFNAYNTANPTARQFVHEMRDDVYDPAQSVKLLDEVTRDDNSGKGRYAFAIVGSMGSPTSSAMLPMVNSRQVPFFGTYSGANHLRKSPPDGMVWNTRGSYKLEGKTITTHLLKRDPDPHPKENIFAYSQSPLTIATDGVADLSEEAANNDQTKALDPYGFSGYSGIVEALQDAGLSQTDIPLASYRATSTNTDIAEQYFFQWVSGLAGRGLVPTIANGKLQVGIAMIPVASAATPFVQGIIEGANKLRAGTKPDQLTDAEWTSVTQERKDALKAIEVTITSISPAGDKLASNLKAAGESTYCTTAYPILVSQVVPFPSGGSTGATQFRKDLEAYDTNIKPGFVNFEGWIAGKVWIDAVTKTGDDLTVESLVSTLSSGTFSLNLGIGPAIAFPVGSHDGSQAVYGSAMNTSCAYEDFTFKE